MIDYILVEHKLVVHKENKTDYKGLEAVHKFELLEADYKQAEHKQEYYK